MVARLATLAALFAALLLVAHAAAFRTTIATVNIDEDIENQQGRRGVSCREQFHRLQNLNWCQRFMRQQSQFGRYEDGNQQQQQDFQQCCQQLWQMDERCRCEGLRQAVMQQLGQVRGEEMQEIMESARDLPNQCRLGPQRCEIRFSLF
ncbi:2S seed storage albumin protein-like [Corylus avellana]|uniref:2S seed storage albumin protein-like n=1 Tax=Corylus avellana TaxID=13451 RepID=UPI001E220C84|nr:2S seed storage albumin protein-like [Corylus avellana]